MEVMGIENPRVVGVLVVLEDEVAVQVVHGLRGLRRKGCRGADRIRQGGDVVEVVVDVEAGRVVAGMS